MIQFFAEGITMPEIEASKISEGLIQIALNENHEIESINYIFCSDQYLLQINKDYLSHDYYTDIITFPLELNPIKADIFISVDRVKENASSFDSSYTEELLRVIAHGLLHLIGYNDKEEAEKVLMRAKEDESITLLRS